MRFLADEGFDARIVAALRGAGHDVAAIAEANSGATDEEVIRRAVRESRVLLTEDRDFGSLVFARGHGSVGVVYLRFPMRTKESVAARLLEVVQQFGDRVADSFVVVQPGRVRFTKPPVR